MKTGIIYIAINVQNGKSYVGQTTGHLDKRVSGHYSDSKRSGHLFSRALRKYNKNDWNWKILASNIPLSKLDLFERAYIWGLSTLTPFGYNAEPGGHKNKILSEETCNKISASKKGGISPNKGKKFTKEQKQKMSKAKSGENNPMYGRIRIHISETRNKISKSRVGKEYKSKYWNIITPYGSKEIIKNLRKYCRDNNLDAGSLYKVANGKASHHKGYKAEMIKIL